MNSKGKKISIIGAGNVGATIAYSLIIDGMASEIVLVDVNKEKAMGEAMDIVQGTPFARHVNIYAGEYQDIAGSDIVVITAGLARKSGQSRLDLAQSNVNIMREMTPELVKYASNAVYLLVSNPVDVLTYAFIKFSGLPETRIVGLGTMLDTARLRAALSRHTGLPPQNVHGYVLGEHGDTAVMPWSLTYIAGVPVEKYCDALCDRVGECGKLDLQTIAEEVRGSGAKVISYKGATFYAVSLSTLKLCDSILKNTNSINTVSTMLHGQYGIEDVCVSLPCVISSQGVERVLEVPLNDTERAAFIHSAKTISDINKAMKM